MENGSHCYLDLGEVVAALYAWNVPIYSSTIELEKWAKLQQWGVKWRSGKPSWYTFSRVGSNPISLKVTAGWYRGFQPVGVFIWQQQWILHLSCPNVRHEVNPVKKILRTENLLELTGLTKPSHGGFPSSVRRFRFWSLLHKSVVNMCWVAVGFLTFVIMILDFDS